MYTYIKINTNNYWKYHYFVTKFLFVIIYVTETKRMQILKHNSEQSYLKCSEDCIQCWAVLSIYKHRIWSRLLVKLNGIRLYHNFFLHFYRKTVIRISSKQNVSSKQSYSSEFVTKLFLCVLYESINCFSVYHEIVSLCYLKA